MKRRLISVAMILLASIVLFGCSGSSSTSPTRSGRLESGDAVLSDGTFVDSYACTATVNGGVSVDMSSPTLQCVIIVIELNSDGTLSPVASSGAGSPNATASWQAVKGQTYIVAANSQDPDTGSYTLTFHDLNSISTRSVSRAVPSAELSSYLGLKKH